MGASLSINDILDQVKRLDRKSRLSLFQRLADLLRKDEIPKLSTMRLSSLSGIGSDIWKSTKDIDEHIDGERQW